MRFNRCLIKASCYSLQSLKKKKAGSFIKSVTGSHSCCHPWRILYLLTKSFVLLANECQATDTVRYLTFGVLNGLIYLSIHASEFKKKHLLFTLANNHVLNALDEYPGKHAPASYH